MVKTRLITRRASQNEVVADSKRVRNAEAVDELGIVCAVGAEASIAR
ncbi:30S ribosomal protein S16 [Candidatus Hodgkinia cicadicola]|nr:30S ribosomal protein S16 [Candidatus Hodgkinia cicadicola]